MPGKPRVSFRRTVPFLLCVAALAAAAPAKAQCPTGVNQWRRWECTLTSASDYLLPGNNGNPYRDLEVKVTYRNTSTNETFSSFGFWDGDLTAAKRKTFKIRGAFPAGTWRWSTTCQLRPTPPAHSAALPNCASDTGLNLAESPAREITVQGIIIGDGNELYNRGFLKKAAGATPRHMAYGDGSPFYWLGDTAWGASMRASTAGDFETYLSNRAFRSQVAPSFPPFTVIQMAPAPMTAGQRNAQGKPDLLNGIPIDLQGRRPFEQVPGCSAVGNPPNNCSRWVTAYWKDFDQKVQNANSKGLAVFVAGVMNPVGEDGPVVVPPTAEAQIFARNFVGRLFGNFVIFSPGFDARPDSFLDLIKAVGCTIEQASCNVGTLTTQTACGNGCKSSRHLIANHPGGGSSVGELEMLQGQPWLAFQMFQSGQAVSACKDGDDTTTAPAEISCQLREMTDRARSLPLTLQGRTPTPNVNGEAVYEGVTTFTGVNYTAYRVRQTAYLSTLSGSLGYTFGACGLFDWGGASNCPGWQPTTTILRESSKQMRFLANFYRGTFWNRLMGNQTEHDRILNQKASTPADQKMVLARDGNSTVFAYLPKEQLEIDLNLGVLTNFPANWTATWCDPRTGNCSATQAAPIGGSNYRFTPLSCGACDAPDWVLKLVNTTSGSAAATLTASRLQVWEAWDEEGSGSHIAARIDDSSGLARKDDFEVSSRKGFSRFPKVAKEGGGQFTVAWQSDMQDGELGGIYARRYDNRGYTLGEEFQVNETAEGDQFHPSISANASGDFVIVWSSRGQDGDGSGVFARRYDRKGSPAGGEFQVNTSTSGDQGFAQTSIGPNGELAVAWESESEEGSAVLAQVFDRSGRRQGPEIRVDVTPRGRLTLASVEMSPSGEVVVTWERFGDDTVTLGRFGQRYDRFGAAMNRFVIAE